MVRPDRKMLTYYVDFTKAIQTRRLTMGVADGRVEADGETIYLVKDMKVAFVRKLSANTSKKRTAHGVVSLSPGSGLSRPSETPPLKSKPVCALGDRVSLRRRNMPSMAFAVRSTANHRSNWRTISTSGNCALWGPTAAYAYLSMEQAIADSGLTEAEVSNERAGLVAGSGGPSTSNFFAAFDAVINKGAPKRMGPFMVTRCMSSTVSACLATPFRIKGVNYSITSACSTSAHCIGNGAELIQMGKQDIVFAGGGEELGLDVVLSVRRDGRDVIEVQRHAAKCGAGV